jgi:hypothetical protein
MKEATKRGLTGASYIWVVTQSVVGDLGEANIEEDFPVGMLGECGGRIWVMGRNGGRVEGRNG